MQKLEKIKKINKRAKALFKEIAINIEKDDEEWGSWSHSFNKGIKNAIMFGTEKERITLRGIFLYWQIQNRIRETSFYNLRTKMMLEEHGNEILMEVLYEKDN